MPELCCARLNLDCKFHIFLVNIRQVVELLSSIPSLIHFRNEQMYLIILCINLFVVNQIFYLQGDRYLKMILNKALWYEVHIIKNSSIVRGNSTFVSNMRYLK